MAIAADFSEFFPHFLITVIYAAVIIAAAIVVFKRKMKADLG